MLSARVLCARGSLVSYFDPSSKNFGYGDIPQAYGMEKGRPILTRIAEADEKSDRKLVRTVRSGSGKLEAKLLEPFLGDQETQRVRMSEGERAALTPSLSFVPCMPVSLVSKSIPIFIICPPYSSLPVTPPHAVHPQTRNCN